MIITEQFKSGREFAEKYCGATLRLTYVGHKPYLCFEGIVFGFRNYGSSTAAMMVTKENNKNLLKFNEYDKSTFTFLKSCPKPQPYDTVFSYYPTDKKNNNIAVVEILKLNIDVQLTYIRNLRTQVLKIAK